MLTCTKHCGGFCRISLRVFPEETTNSRAACVLYDEALILLRIIFCMHNLHTLSYHAGNSKETPL